MTPLQAKIQAMQLVGSRYKIDLGVASSPCAQAAYTLDLERFAVSGRADAVVAFTGFTGLCTSSSALAVLSVAAPQPVTHGLSGFGTLVFDIGMLPYLPTGPLTIEEEHVFTLLIQNALYQVFGFEGPALAIEFPFPTFEKGHIAFAVSAACTEGVWNKTKLAMELQLQAANMFVAATAKRSEDLAPTRTLN